MGDVEVKGMSDSAIAKLREAHGKAKLLAVGVSDYDSGSGFSRLSQCANDALTIRDSFRDHWQLNPDKDHLNVLVSGGKEAPSRGNIIKCIKALAASAYESDRIVFFFSGHGHRIDDDFFLVPEDAYSDDDPTAMVNFERVKEILLGSQAKQVIILLDACMSGPTLAGRKLVAAGISNRYLRDYLAKTTGVAVISSSSTDQASYAKSPNPKLSLFTYYLVQALGGDDKALDEHKFVTMDSLYQYVCAMVERTARSYQKTQRPEVYSESSGTLVLADYSQSIISPSSFDPGEFPLSALIAREAQGFQVDMVLTNIRRWNGYSAEYLEERVNSNLSEYLEEDIGRLAADLIQNMGFDISEVGTEEDGLDFPGGTLAYSYRADDKKTGELVSELRLDRDWIQSPERVVDLLDCLGLDPSEIAFDLSKSIEPQEMVAGITAAGWQLKSILPQKIRASSAHGVSLTATKRTLTFEGLSVQEIFGLKGKGNVKKLAYGAFALLGT